MLNIKYKDQGVRGLESEKQMELSEDEEIKKKVDERGGLTLRVNKT